jgi:hypothetical protein
MIVGRDLMSQLGIILDFDGQTMTWDESTIKMKEHEDLFDINSPINEFCWHEESYESQALSDASPTYAQKKASIAEKKPKKILFT